MATPAPSPAVTPHDDDLIDVPELLDRCADDAAFVGELLSMFAANAPDVFDRLAATVAAGQPQAAARSAHALRGTALNVGANPLGSRLADVETALAAGHPVDLIALGDLFARTIAAIDGCQADLATHPH